MIEAPFLNTTVRLEGSTVLCKAFYKCFFLFHKGLRRLLCGAWPGMQRHVRVTSHLLGTRKRRCKTAYRSDLITRRGTSAKEKAQENTLWKRNGGQGEPSGLLYTGACGLLSRRWFWLTFSPVIIKPYTQRLNDTETALMGRWPGYQYCRTLSV